MQEFLTLLSKTTLFCGIPDAELRVLLTSLCPIQRSYHAGELILLAGYEEREIGIVLNGQIEAERTTLSGEALPIAQMGAGSIFGDVLSGSHTVSPVTVAAKTDCVVLSIAHARLLSSLPSNPAAAKLLQNLIATISDKYFALSGRLDLLMTHRLRDRIVLFLTQQGADRAPVTLSMNRFALARFINCERSALCRELSRMQAEGLLLVQHNTFTLL